jgi:hypothetical protein
MPTKVFVMFPAIEIDELIGKNLQNCFYTKKTAFLWWASCFTQKKGLSSVYQVPVKTNAVS